MSNTLTHVAAALSGRYRVERELGAGGMATVYLAHDARHDRRVAIKVLHPEMAASIGSDRFLAEIRTTARLTHPNILPLFDSGEARAEDAAGPSFLYYVMPLVTGESLRARLEREKQLDVDDALRIAREVADALAYAHAQGVIHRDVKPENILLQSGHALVTDFGIARPPTPADSARMTQVGVTLGTPLYMSPEQAAGDPQLDGRTDLYSLGCVVFEMLAGAAPFTGPTIESILVQRFTQPPPRVAPRRSSVPRHIDGALYRAMARDREERFGTMESFVAALAAPRDDRAPSDAARSVAVLPFTNMSADPENEYFGDGIAEEIINALTQVPGLRVAARTSAFSFKGKSDDLRLVGEKLGVGTVLEGSVRRAGDRLRITAQLINVADGYHLWSERYDRERTDIFAIQDEIARAIATRLRKALGSPALTQWENRFDRLDDHLQQLVKAPTDNLEAYELYLKARSLMKERGAALLKAIELFEQAVALDPEFAPALAYLAHALVLSSFWGVSHPARIGERAARAAASALEHDGRLVAAHSATALVAMCIRFDRDAARDSWQRAVDLDPSDPEPRLQRAAFDLSYVRGESDAAIRETRIAVDLDPLSAYASAQLAVVLSFAGRFDDAIVEAQRARELDANSFFAIWSLVNAQSSVLEPDAFVALMGTLLPKYGRHPWFLMLLVLVGVRGGRRDLADAYYAELVARSLSEYVQPTVLACAASHVGKREAGLTYLRQALEIRDPALAAFLLHYKPFALLRAEPEFAEIVAPLGWWPNRGSPIPKMR